MSNNNNERKVLKYYPNAKLLKDSDGLYYIGNLVSKSYDIEDDYENSDDLEFIFSDTSNYEDLLSEYLLPHTTSVEEAWKLALTCCKTTQNFNRTHPERMIIDYEDEERIIRLSEKSDKIQSSIQNNRE